MKKYHCLIKTLPIWLVLITAIWACSTDQRDSSQSEEQSTESQDDMMGHTENDQSQSIFENPPFKENERNPDWYVYDYADKATEPVQPGEANKVTTSQKRSAPKAKAEPVVYTISQTDRPPLFSKECLDAKDPEKCSNKALKAWIRQNIQYPEDDLEKGNDGLEYITFIINQRGKISTIKRLESKYEECDNCGVVLLDAIVKMPDWEPARLKGKPVPVIVTLPVRFLAL